MVTLKRKYGKSLVPQYDYEVLEKAVQFFADRLNIQQVTLISLKRKLELWGEKVGVCYKNKDTGGITIHIYVHRHSSTKPTLIALAHEMVHAWQIDNGKAVCEKQAELLSLRLVCKFLGGRHEFRNLVMARRFLH